MSSPAPTSPPSNTTAPPPPAISPPPPATSPPPPVTSPPPVSSPPPPPLPVASPPPVISPPPPANPSPPPSSSPPPPTPTTPPSPPSSSPPPPTPTTTPSPPPSSSPPPPPTPTTTPSPPSSSPPPPTPTTTPPPPSSPSSSSPPPPPPRTIGNSPPPPPLPSSSSPPPPPSTATTTPSSSSSSSTLSTGVIVGITLGGVAALAILSILFIFCCKKKRKARHEFYLPPPSYGPKDNHYGVQVQPWQHNTAPPPPDHQISIPTKPQADYLSLPPYSSVSAYSESDTNPTPQPAGGVALGYPKSTFTLEELSRATNNFSTANLLGQGGFGYVHKGVLPNGKVVAIKQLKAGSGQGEREFHAEVDTISRVHHRHLVSLVGYCITGSSRLLVYEFLPNDTLEFHLHGKGQSSLDWATRLKIALGASKGLAYLHEDCHPKIIHRDIKASNILLDLNFEAQVSDFGLARFTSDIDTHVSTRVMGTFGYLAPEYASSGKLTDRSDVYSFGVVLLELITGKRPVDTSNTFMDDSLVDWARPILTQAMEDGNFDSLVDPKLRVYNHVEMARMVACAAVSVRHSARRRPRMSQVVRALEGDVSLDDLNEGGIKPGHSTVYGSHNSDYDTGEYKVDMKNFRKLVLDSQEYASSEYSGGRTTSEYGLIQSGSSSEVLTTEEMETRRLNKDSRGFSDL